MEGSVLGLVRVMGVNAILDLLLAHSFALSSIGLCLLLEAELLVGAVRHGDGLLERPQ